MQPSRSLLLVQAASNTGWRGDGELRRAGGAVLRSGHRRPSSFDLNEDDLQGIAPIFVVLSCATRSGCRRWVAIRFIMI